MDLSIFKAYDVRGLYPEQLNRDNAYAIAQAYSRVLNPSTVAVGNDVRKSSPELKQGLIDGFTDAGVNVVDIGDIITDMLYFAVGKYGYSGGIVVTASHNPSNYNGLKFVREGATAISSESGLFEIRDAIDPEGRNTASTRGTVTRKDVMEEYLAHVQSFVDITSIKSDLTFVGNANFGFGSRPVRRLVDRLGLNLIPLNFEPDASFPKGQPDPMLPTNRTETEALITETKADFGVAWDADADRAMFFDERGEFIQAVYVTAMFADYMLQKHGPNKIIVDLRLVWPSMKAIEKNGGEAIITKGGHAFMKDRLRNENALFGGETVGHYYFRDNFYSDNGLIPFLMMLEIKSRDKRPLSQIAAPYMEGHYMSGEQNYRVKDPKRIIETVQNQLGGQGKEDFLDGYTLEAKDWRLNIRPSNTEPLLRLNIEARRKEAISEVLRQIEKIIEAE